MGNIRQQSVIDENPWIQAHQKEVSKEQAANACAAYCALTEQTDSYVGQVRAAFERYAKKAGHRAIFGYTSDHGDTWYRIATLKRSSGSSFK